ncbi:MAG: hypothetical protein HY749_24735 [Gammaproteobacteria bacterium]|nr:hypothetical protein [Gammaproteobacteria bacterium]
MSFAADELEALRRYRARLKRRDASLRAGIRLRLKRSVRRPAAFAGAALVGAALGLLRPGSRREREMERAMPSYARWLVIAAELSGPVLSLVALARRRRGSDDGRRARVPRAP